MLNNGPYLVNTPAATAFLETVSIEAGRKSLLGDRENLPGRAYNAVGEAHIAVGESVPKITKLTKDETRNDVLKHEAAMHLAEKVAATIERSHATMLRVVDELDAEAIQVADAALTLRPDREGIHAEMRAFIREQAKREDGLAEIRRIIGQDAEAAAVLANTPAWLLSLNEKVHQGMYGDVVKKHVPKAATLLSQAMELSKVAAKYPAVATNVRRYFYSPGIAGKARSRVEV